MKTAVGTTFVGKDRRCNRRFLQMCSHHLANLDELNAWLLDKCIAYAKAHRHSELADQTIWDVFEAERPKLIPPFEFVRGVRFSLSDHIVIPLGRLWAWRRLGTPA